MSNGIVRDRITDCGLKDLVDDQQKLDAFVEMLRAAIQANYIPIRVENVTNTSGVVCLEISYQV
jgi:hypothetical protein